MSNPSKDQKSEDRFAQLLGEQHDRIMKRPPGESENTETSAEQDPQLQSRLEKVAPILELLEEIKSKQSFDLSPNQDTQLDAGTQKNARSVDQIQSAGVLPNLEHIGRFEIIEPIGRGGFGTIVRANDPELNRQVAIKIPRLESALSSESRIRFQREARAAASLDHPNIVSVFESGSEAGVDYIVTQLIEGVNLTELLAQGIKLDPLQSAQIVSKLAGGLAHAHQRGILHRDIKPSNIMVEEMKSEASNFIVFEPQLTDFGLASILDDQRHCTQTGAALGTPSFMSPEQASGSTNEITQSTDIYGLGGVLYQLLTGRPPFESRSAVETMRAIVEHEPRAPRTLNPTIPKDLEAICLKCLEKKPGSRYRSAQDLQLDLQRYLENRPVSARHITELDRGIRWIQRHRALSSALGLLALAIVGALVTTTVLWLRSENLRERSDRAVLLAERRLQDHEEAIDSVFAAVSRTPEIENSGPVSVRREMLAKVNQLYSDLVSENPTDDVLKRKKFDSLLKLVNLKNKLHADPVGLGVAKEAMELVTAENQKQLTIHQRISAKLAVAQSFLAEKQTEKGKSHFEAALILARSEYAKNNSPSDDERIEFAKTLSQASEMVGDYGFRELAIELAVEAIDIWEGTQTDWIDDDDSNLALLHSLLVAGSAYAYSERVEEARLLIKAACDFMETTLGDDVKNLPDVQFDLSEAYRIRAWCYIDFPETCYSHLDQATVTLAILISKHPTVVKYRIKQIEIEYYRALTNFIAARHATNKKPHHEKALKLFETNLDLAESLMNHFPDDGGKIMKAVKSSIAMIGNTAGSLGQHDKQLTSLTRALKLNEQVLDNTGSQSDRVLMLGAVGNLGRYYLETKQIETAINNLEYSSSELIKILESDSMDGQAQRFLHADLENLANCHSKQNDFEKALQVYRTAMAHLNYMDPAIMKGREAVYLVKLNRIDEAMNAFLVFDRHLRKVQIYNQMILDSCMILTAIEETKTDSLESAKTLRDQVVKSALDALQQISLSSDKQFEQILANKNSKPLKQTPEFKAWKAKQGKK